MGEKKEKDGRVESTRKKTLLGMNFLLIIKKFLSHKTYSVQGHQCFVYTSEGEFPGHSAIVQSNGCNLVGMCPMGTTLWQG